MFTLPLPSVGHEKLRQCSVQERLFLSATAAAAAAVAADLVFYCAKWAAEGLRCFFRKLEEREMWLRC